MSRSTCEIAGIATAELETRKGANQLGVDLDRLLSRRSGHTPMALIESASARRASARKAPAAPWCRTTIESVLLIDPIPYTDRATRSLC